MHLARATEDLGAERESMRRCAKEMSVLRRALAEATAGFELGYKSGLVGLGSGLCTVMIKVQLGVMWG